MPGLRLVNRGGGDGRRDIQATRESFPRVETYGTILRKDGALSWADRLRMGRS